MNSLICYVGKTSITADEICCWWINSAMKQAKISWSCVWLQSIYKNWLYQLNRNLMQCFELQRLLLNLIINIWKSMIWKSIAEISVSLLMLRASGVVEILICYFYKGFFNHVASWSTLRNTWKNYKHTLIVVKYYSINLAIIKTSN